MKIKESPSGQTRASKTRTLRESEVAPMCRNRAASLQESPLRSFKIEHGLYCRLVIAPKDSYQLNPEHLHALRIRAAWRAICAAIKQYGNEEAFLIARRMAGTWKMACSLPNRPPSFDFDETDAVSMVLNAKAWVAGSGGASN